jgi:Matrixin
MPGPSHLPIGISPLPLRNHFERIPFTVSGIDVAAGSQGSNFDRDKVNLAWREALSMWTTAAPVSFVPPTRGETPMLQIHFVQDGTTFELGATAGFITRTPTGPLGSAGINIFCDNDFFIDRFREPVLHPVHPGPFDFITVIAHETGHALGLNHPSDAAVPAIMSADQGDAVKRQLFPFDIHEVQRLQGSISLAAPVGANLATSGQLINAGSGVQLEQGSFGLLVFGPMETTTFLDVVVPAKGKWVNALRLTFTTVTENVFVNRVETFDGIIPIQSFAPSARSLGTEGLAGRQFDMRLGFLDRPTLGNDMLVRLELFFTKQGGQTQSDLGVLQVAEIGVDTLLPALVIHP